MTERQINLRIARARKAERLGAPNPNADFLDKDEVGNLREAAAVAQLNRATLRAEDAARDQAEYEAKLEAGHDFSPKPRSGGPRTPEGKAKSSLNNLQHGLTGSFRIIGHERQQEFDSVLTALQLEHQPATTTEHHHIEKMAESMWLSRRAQRLQDFALQEDDIARLNVYLRYQTTNDRAYFKHFAEFERLKKARLKEERELSPEFVSQKRHQQQKTDAWEAARVRLANARAEEIELKNEKRRLALQKLASPAPQPPMSKSLNS